MPLMTYCKVFSIKIYATHESNILPLTIRIWAPVLHVCFLFPILVNKENWTHHRYVSLFARREQKRSKDNTLGLFPVPSVNTLAYALVFPGVESSS